MKIKIQVVIEDNDQTFIENITCLERQALLPETVGLSLSESKKIASGIQKTMATYQIKNFISQERLCDCCGKNRLIKSYHSIIYRTLFGKLSLKSPRLYHCDCQSTVRSSFSPLAKLLIERTSPELYYLESKWASLMSYGMTANFLREVLPVNIKASSVFYHTQQVALRLEKELGAEQTMFIEGCPREWNRLPKPDEPLVVGIDGGYVHAREGSNRKAGWFEVIVGKSMQDNHEIKRFGFVTNYDTKPKRRLHEMLKKQGFQMNQGITFLSDGGDTVRDLQWYLSPQAEHILDWFHITMKLTNAKQMAQNIVICETMNVSEQLERVKWYLWHGNVFCALELTEFLISELEILDDENQENHIYNKLAKFLEEFYQYIKNNSGMIPNYQDRYHYGEVVSSAFVESTVNEVISKRMVKKQQMRWTTKGAHLLLQVRIKTLNHELRQSFCQWYPKMEADNEKIVQLAA